MQPSFGTDDRRRILDIHKERKKKRKQDKKKLTISPSRDRCHENGECDLGNNSSIRSLDVKNGGHGVGSTKEDERQSSGGISEGPEGENNIGNNVGKSTGNVSSQHGGIDSNEINYNQLLGSTEAHERCPSNGSFIEPQHNQQSQSSVTPPPGLDMSSNFSCMTLDDSQAFPHPLKSADRPGSSSPAIFIQFPPADALFITVPHNERLETAPGQPESSLSVPAARHFISVYYSHFDGNSLGARIVDLACYYTSEAQKSVSVGGAHSVVTGRTDIVNQICNFAGTSFEVRGVVAQDTADRKGVHILVTGIARTSLSGSQGGLVASFAHSISLVPIEVGAYNQRSGIACTALLEALAVGYPFQIHNDALALLSGDSGPASPISSPRPTHQPPPPPGLF